MAGELDGPRLEPPGGQPAKRLVVFLHGYGADGNDLIDIGRAWQGLLPDKVKPDAIAGEIKSTPPVLLVHGAEDDLIPAQALFQSAQALAALEVPVEWHLSEGVGHGIDQEGLRHGGAFLAKRFGLRA